MEDMFAGLMIVRLELVNFLSGSGDMFAVNSFFVGVCLLHWLLVQLGFC